MPSEAPLSIALEKPAEQIQLPVFHAFRLWFIVCLVVLTVAASCTKTNSIPPLDCHTQVKLRGTIEQKSFPGPPNYDDITKNPEKYWILKLRDPIDVAKDPDSPDPDESQPQKDVREIQLVTDYGKYRQFLGREVVVTGSLWQGFTVHHKTAVLMAVDGVERGK